KHGASESAVEQRELEPLKSLIWQQIPAPMNGADNRDTGEQPDDARLHGGAEEVRVDDVDRLLAHEAHESGDVPEVKAAFGSIDNGREAADTKFVGQPIFPGDDRKAGYAVGITLGDEI